MNGPETAFANAVKGDFKGKISLVLYLASIGVAFLTPIITDALFVAVAIIWIVPYRRFEPLISSRP